jgi:hypothetical protein
MFSFSGGTTRSSALWHLSPATNGLLLNYHHVKGCHQAVERAPTALWVIRVARQRGALLQCAGKRGLRTMELPAAMVKEPSSGGLA